MAMGRTAKVASLTAVSAVTTCDGDGVAGTEVVDDDDDVSMVVEDDDV